MPFVRFSRDKRGYEYVYLVEASTRNRQAPPHVLYWYRTPPSVRVGREPFDAEVRQALEARYRDIKFDWKAITAAHPPDPQIETWRERRRLKRDAKRLQGTPPPGSAPSSEPSAESESVDDELADAAEAAAADPVMLEAAEELDPGALADSDAADDAEDPGEE